MVRYHPNKFNIINTCHSVCVLLNRDNNIYVWYYTCVYPRSFSYITKYPFLDCILHTENPNRMRINIFHFLYIFKHTIKIQILWHSIPSILLDFIVLFSPEKKKMFFISLRFLSSNYLNDIPRKLYSENNINFSINPKSCFKFLSSLTVEFSWRWEQQNSI